MFGCIRGCSATQSQAEKGRDSIPPIEDEHQQFRPVFSCNPIWRPLSNRISDMGNASSITKHAFGIRTHEVVVFQTSLLGKWVQVSVLQKYCISLRLMQQIQISKFNNSIIHHFQDDVKWKFLITWTLFVNYSPIKWWSSRNLPWFFLASMSMVSFRTCCEISCVFNLKWSGMAVMLRRH